MKYTVPQGAAALAQIFAENGCVLYLVGGYVRNLILGLPGGDLDVCSAATPDMVMDFLRRAGLGVIDKAAELGTIEAHLQLDGRKFIFEHTTFRSDEYPDGGAHRPDRVVFTDYIEADARRRDFTVNALYLDIAAGKVVDPTGRGLRDIEARMLCAAANDPDVTIRDDGLRILRMARFAAELGFSVDSALRECAQKRAALLADISAERKRDELRKILMADTKYQSVAAASPRVGLDLLRQVGAIEYVLPRLYRGDGVKQSAKYHAHDVLGHGMAACTAAEPVWPLRLAALLHDIGKPAALAQSGTMHGHEVIGAALAAAEMTDLKIDRKTHSIVVTLIENHMFDLEGRAKPITIRRRAVMLGRDTFRLLIALRRADFSGSGMGQAHIASADNWQAELDRMDAEGVPWRIADLEVSGDDIMRALNVGPSPAVGEILTLLHTACVRRPKNNRRELLMQMAKKLAFKVLP